MSDLALSAAVRSSLLALQRATELIDRTNSRLASGLRVRSPVDDPVAFFSSKALTDRAFDFTERMDGIDQGISTVSAALDGVESIDSLVRQLKGIANSLKSATGTQFTDLVTQFNDIRAQIGDLANDAEYQGVNLVDNTSETLTVNFSNNTTSLLTINAVHLQETGLGIDGMVVRANSQISFTGTPTSGVSLGNTALTAGSFTGATQVSDFGGQLVVTYNGTGAVITNTGAEIVFSLNTQVSITVAVGSGDATTVTQGQTLTLQLASFNAAAASGVSAAAGDTGFFGTTFVTGAEPSVTGVFVGILSGQTGALAQSGIQQLAVNTAGSLQSGIDFVAAGQSSDADTVIAGLDSALTTLRSQSQKLGSNVALLQTRLDFTNQYVNTLEEGSGKLTLADLNQEGANLLALQTRQQLGISALAFAGQSEQGILA
ncbi:MAG: flagellin, partial [Rhodospirillaceae bacterium]